MDTIRVTFPAHIPRDIIKQVLEENMHANTQYKCEVKFEKFEDEENVFLISSEPAEAFYLIGMTASQIIKKYRIRQ